MGKIIDLARAFTAGGGALRPITSKTTDPATQATDAQVRAIEDMARARIKHFREQAGVNLRSQGYDPEQEEEYRVLAEIEERKGLLESEQARLRVLFRRLDNLYYPDYIGVGGPDHWPEERKPGRVHISVNNPPVYVDIPASLQAVVPVENYIALSSEEADRDAAARAERLYFEWKDETEFELLAHKACVVKGLYGFTYGKVMWDPIEKHPIVRLIDTPENLYVGWGNSDFTRLDWTIYCYGLSPQAIQEDFGLSVEIIRKGDEAYPNVVSATHDDPIRTVKSDTAQMGGLRGARPSTMYEDLHVEVYDYWYKKSKGKNKRPEIWNAIYVGNALVKNQRHPEYDDIPYVPLPNTYVPGSPYGRPELYDLEQLIREKDERMTNAAQMLETITDGQMWQLVGPEAPDDVPTGAIPKANKVATPGPGNELKAIQPFIPQYAIADFIKLIDSDMEVVSGLNELLLGRAPATILGSSKAIAALVANYEARISMKRSLLYQWRKRVWKMAAKVWEAKDSKVRAIIDGQYRIDVSPPELTPKDELESGQLAMSLVQNRLWSMRRAMNKTGVEDPEDELNLIRSEQTDAALNPAAVTQQATLLGAMQSLGIQPPQASVNQAQNAARSLNRSVPGSPSLNQPENQGNPPGESVPANAQAANGAPATEGNKAVVQSLTQGGETKGRIMTSTDIA